MKKKIKIIAFFALVVVWSILVLISSMFIGDLMWELTDEIYSGSPFIPTIISISTSIVFAILTYSSGVSMLYICFGFSNDKEE